MLLANRESIEFRMILIVWLRNNTKERNYLSIIIRSVFFIDSKFLCLCDKNAIRLIRIENRKCMHVELKEKGSQRAQKWNQRLVEMSQKNAIYKKKIDTKHQ